MSPPAETAIALRGASIGLEGRTVLTEVDLEIAAGEFVAVLGSNGAGKTTLLRVILGLIGLQRGEAEVLGSRPGRARPAIGYVPQRHALAAGARVRGVDLVRLGLDGHRWGVPLPIPDRLDRNGARRTARRRVAAAIELVGADTFAGRPMSELSGGEQQRLLIAQAMVREPRILLLDEPLDGLDLASQRSITALVAGVCRSRGVTVLLVAHDVNPLLGALDRVVYLAGGRAVTGTPDEVIRSDTLSGLYGVQVEVLRAADGRLVVVGQPEALPAHGPHHAHDHDAR